MPPEPYNKLNNGYKLCRTFKGVTRVQRKSVLQLAIRASCS